LVLVGLTIAASDVRNQTHSFEGPHIPLGLAKRILRHSPRMTHLCSPKVTHTENTICRRARNSGRPRRASFSPNPFILPEPVQLSRPPKVAQTPCRAAKAPPQCRAGLLLASKVGSFLASAEGTRISPVTGRCSTPTSYPTACTTFRSAKGALYTAFNTLWQKTRKPCPPPRAEGRLTPGFLALS